MSKNSNDNESTRSVSEPTGEVVTDSRAEREPIAIIGIGCRFPGRANGPAAFWRLLCDGVDAIEEVPPDRWNVRSFYDPDPATPGKTYARWGGFIDGIDQFDANFFGISPREASSMDPQQRLLLEVAYEAIEDGGQALNSLAGSRTGVFIGISTLDYAHLQSTYDEKGSIDTYTTPGSVMSIAANRISYCFDLKGPSIIVDTACSSSLVAAHLACGSIWSGESDMALTGGVNVILNPDSYIGFCRLSMLSPTGRCKAFDASGDGFVRGEGAGVIILKPLSRALADGDDIYALIRGTTVNQDGHTNGITVPSLDSQIAMLKEAYQQVGVPPETVQYVEAHGTGTSVGDPIEANALGAVLSANRPDSRFCAIGSVKTNIGHLEAGSGIAGLIKTALSLRHGLIPPSLHFKTPNPHIQFNELKLRVQESLGPWPETGNGPRLAGVNSFGFGGTNAHVVLSQAPRQEKKQSRDLQSVGDLASNLDPPQASVDESPNPARLVPLSARSPEALKSLAQAYRDLLQDSPNSDEHSLNQLGYNLSLRRTHHDHRLSLVAHTREELVEHLEAFLAGETRPGMYSGHTVTGQVPKLAFVFSGQGPQWWAMGRQLVEQEPVFRNTIEQCDALLSQCADWSLMDELTRDEAESRLQETSIAQPALFALQVALAALWRSWGVQPEAVVGHSVGEVAAAHIAGVLDLDEAVRVIFHRGRTMDLASSKGKMLGAGLTLEEAEELIRGYEDRVSIAAVNSPSSVSLSGEAEALDEIYHLLEERNVFARVLRVQYAFHSPQMEPVRDELLRSLQDIRLNPTTRLLVSTVTGQPVEGRELDADYWWQNVRHSVRFAAAVGHLVEQDYRVFLEIGPHPVLSAYIAECLRERDASGTILASLRRQEEERQQMLGSLGALYTLGYPINWKQWYPDAGRPMRLPGYPWQHESYWHENEAARKARLGTDAHPLLGRRLKSAEPTWQVQISQSAFPYLADHKVQGHIVFPATGYLEMGLAVAKEMFGGGPYVVEDIDFHKALFLPETGEPPTLQTIFSQTDSTFSIYAQLKRSDPQWTLLAGGKVRSESPGKERESVHWEQLRNECPQELPKRVRYQKAREKGLQYGPSFQGIEQLWRRDGEIAVGIVEGPERLLADLDAYLIHPAIFDAGLQVLSEAVSDESFTTKSDILLPVHIDQVRFLARPGPRVWSYARLVKEGTRTLEGDVHLLDEIGNALAEVRGLKAQSIDMVQDATSEAMDNWIYEIQWQLRPRPEVISDRPPVDFLPPAEEMKRQLEAEVDRLNELLDSKTRFRRIETDLNQLCSAYIINAFNQLGWNFPPQQQVTVASLARMLGVASQHHRLLGRFLDLLSEDGWLKKNVGRASRQSSLKQRRDACFHSGQWQVCQAPSIIDVDDTWTSVLQRYPALYAELMLTASCGRHLADVLQGTIDPKQLIFPDASLTTAEHLYQDAPSFKLYNFLVARVMALGLERVPEGRGVRLLEIGGGTAGMTSYVLPKLPADQVEYIFTDISPLFLHRAEQKLRDYPFVTYQLLDIEKEPTEQEFEPHSFDFILASNVLHATSDLRQALGHVQTLLTSGGLFILLETDHPFRWVDLVFGLTEGWWRFHDHDLRPSYPLLSRQKWLQVLEEVGFSTPIAVSDVNDVNEPSQTVFVAGGPRVEAKALDIKDQDVVAPTSERARRWLIFADQSGVGQHMAEFFQSRGDKTVLVLPGNVYERINDEQFRVCPDRPEDFQQLLQVVVRSNRMAVQGVIHCWSLDSPPTEETTLASLERSEILGCHSIMHFIQAWDGLQGVKAPNLWLITKGAQAVGQEITSVSIAQSPLCGLGRVISNEHQEFHCKMVDLSPQVSPTELRALCEELVSPDEENEIALRGHARYVPRLTRTTRHTLSNRGKKRVTPGNDAFRLETSAPGVLDNLALRETSRRRPGPGEVEIQVLAAALNFRDVMKALGIYPTDGDDALWLGDECAGTITVVGEGVDGLKLGDDVLAIAPRSFSSFVNTNASFVIHKPAHHSFEDATTIPIAFLTAYYALHHLGRISPGERVLIHSASGGVGLAAVQIAQHVGAEVFATAGTPEKRAFLESLGVQHIMDSRSLSFADEIRDFTHGRGVDLVLNSLAGEAITKGLACLAPYGRFLEIGKRDIYQNSKLGLRIFKNNLSFFAVDLGQVMADRPALLNRLWGEMLRLFESNRLHPLPHRVFPIGEAVNAFRHMAQAKHIGKVVLSFRESDVLVEPLQEKAVSFSSDATYLITGGLGGFGLAVAQWLVDNGARHLVLMGRRGVASDEAREAVSLIERKGAQVVVARADVAREEDVARVLNDIRQSLPPLRGLIHAAMVLDDGILLQLNRERFRNVTAPKILGAWNLHRLTLGLSLDVFILFSSATTMFGNPGQGNYVAANAFLDALAHHRRQHNLPAMSISWGHISDAGYVARHGELGNHLTRIGIKGFPAKQAMEIMGHLLLERATQMGVMDVDWQRWATFPSSHPSPRLSTLLSPEALDDRAGEDYSRIRDVLLAASPDNRPSIIEPYLRDQVARVLGMSPANLELDRSLTEMGLDSLMTVELKNRIEKEIGVTLPTVELMHGPNLRKLSQVLLEQLTGSDTAIGQHAEPEIQPQSSRVQDGQGAEELLRKIDDLSEEEIDALLDDLVDDRELEGLLGQPEKAPISSAREEEIVDLGS